MANCGQIATILWVRGRKRTKQPPKALPPNYVKEWREARGYAIEKLSELTGLGVSTISGIERQANDTRLETLKKIADALGTTVPALLASPPNDDGDIWTIWEELGRKNRRGQAIAHLKVINQN